MKTKKEKFRTKEEHEVIEKQGKKEAYKRSRHNFRTPQQLQDFLKQNEDDYLLEENEIKY